MSTQTTQRATPTGYAQFDSGQNSLSDQANRESRITQEAILLEKSIAYLNELTALLERRIHPILSIEMPRAGTALPEDQAEPTPAYSTVSGTFISLREKVDVIAVKVNNLLDRIEL